ncbi:tetratricopeptide repeat protein [Granulicella arctica]|uniref:tetratricopeptide repeat protein n=1 Tax=Granulicella arctica TaxID=940613 RepID=UPI0021E0C4DC|nr:tetratricopeptide repeat protein [Granulicella arctica]
MVLSPTTVLSRRLLVTSLGTLLTLAAAGQTPSQTQSSGSSSSSEQPAPTQSTSTSRVARIAQPEAGGSAITLETSEPLFDIAVGLNACGYDTDLAASNPVRLEIRQEVNDALTGSAPARDSRDALCAYIRQHTLNDAGLNLAQYVSLALYVTPNPELTPSVPETDLPPDSTQVVNILPLLRTFSETVHLHALWIEHRPQYEALVTQIHDPLTRMILDTNIYLGLPVSSYDGRRFLVLLEPMLAPSATNARIYSNDSIVVTSPIASSAANGKATVRMDQIRHTYLHYEVEPLVYARAASMDRLLPLLKPVQIEDSPLDFAHRSDIVALLTECLIKAVEARTMDVGIPKPVKPNAVKTRTDMEHYDAEMVVYDRQAEGTRRKLVERNVRQGWVLVDYFYDRLGIMEKDNVSLKEYIGEMVYGMDVDRQRHHEEQITFFPPGSRDLLDGHDVVRRVPQQPVGLRLAELKMMQGDTATAHELAEKALADPTGDHPRAHYLLARLDLMDRQPDEAISHFSEALKTSKDPRTLAWSHIYLGRLYDIQSNRPKALDEYKAALSTRDSLPDTKTAAEVGLKQPFALPQREAMRNGTTGKPADKDDKDDAPFDPSGKAEKEAYKPPVPPVTPHP